MAFPSTQTFERSILLASLPNLSPPHFLDPAISWAAKHTRTRLVIVLFSRHFNVRQQATLSVLEHQAVSRTKSWDAVQKILMHVYVQATKMSQEIDNVLMDVDVVLKGLNEDLDSSLGNDMDICFRVTGESIAVPLPESIACLRQSYITHGENAELSITPSLSSDSSAPSSSESESTPSLYPVVALGGTFDHLHAGHKILLSMAAWITGEKLIVGVTDDALLVRKSNPQHLESFTRRSSRIEAFIRFFNPTITPSIVPIIDVYGPTGWDPNIQALVVSKETLSGAEAIAKHRAEKNLPPLQPFLIDVISATNASLEKDDADWLKEHKLSSTYIRAWIAEKKGKQGE